MHKGVISCLAQIRVLPVFKKKTNATYLSLEGDSACNLVTLFLDTYSRRGIRISNEDAVRGDENLRLVLMINRRRSGQ